MGKKSRKKGKRLPHFKAVKLPDLGTNSEWAINNLPAVRMAQVIVGKSEDELEVIVRRFLDNDEDGVDLLVKLLKEFDRVRDHLKGIREVVQMADARVMVTVARIDQKESAH